MRAASAAAMSSRIRASRLSSPAISGFQANRPNSPTKITNVIADQKARSALKLSGTPSSCGSSACGSRPVQHAAARLPPWRGSPPSAAIRTKQIARETADLNAEPGHRIDLVPENRRHGRAYGAAAGGHARSRRRDDANDQCEKRHAFDQGGRDDHRRLDLAGDFRLPGHALDGRGTDASDAVAGAQDRHPRPDGPGKEDPVAVVGRHRRKGQCKEDADCQCTDLHDSLHVTLSSSVFAQLPQKPPRAAVNVISCRRTTATRPRSLSNLVCFGLPPAGVP